MEKNEAFFMFMVVAILLSVMVASSVLYLDASKDNEVFSSILHADLEIGIAGEMSQRANDLYNEASLSYEQGDFSAVGSHCRLARGHFSDSSQKYLDVKATLESKSDDPIITTYANGLVILSETQLNLFEACEHFESASRHFADDEFEQGNAEIESMNEKIREHDDNVRKYNSILADYKVELGRRL